MVIKEEAYTAKDLQNSVPYIKENQELFNNASSIMRSRCSSHSTKGTNKMSLPSGNIIDVMQKA